MSSREFYDYIIEKYNLDGTSARLLNNILTYVAAQGFVDLEDQHNHLSALLDGTFGLERHEVELCAFR